MLFFQSKSKELCMTDMESRACNVSIPYCFYLYLTIAGGGSSGSTGGFGGFGHPDFFTFSSAEDVFKNFFGGHDPFADFMDHDDFFDGHGIGQ